MRGDALASGQRSAVFSVAPNFKFNEEEMRKDLGLLPSQSFINKYMITQLEYDLLCGASSEEAVNSFAEEMKRQAEFYERGLQTDQAQAATLRRECFITPFVSLDLIGRVIVDRDEPATPKGARGRLLIPRAMRKEKTLLPTTGHIIKAEVFDSKGTDVKEHFLGKRILFGQMSGTPICFKQYPTWILLEISEILGWVDKEDVEVIEETLEPMV